MKSIYLLNTNDKANPVFLLADIKDKLDGFTDIVKDGIKAEVIIGFDNISKKCAEVKNRINFSKINASKKEITIDSPFTKKCVGIPGLTVIAILQNVLGKRIGYICSDGNGKLMTASSDVLKNSVSNKKIRLTNMFIRKGELTLLDSAINTPTMIVGKKLVDKGLTVSKVSEKFKPISRKALDGYRGPIKAMIAQGFTKYVVAYKLNNAKFPNDTLWFYLHLMRVNQADVIPAMLTTAPFGEDQLQEIYKGLKSGVDVTKYAKLDVDSMQMAKVRKQMEKGLFTGIVIPAKLREMMDNKDKNVAKARKAWAAAGQKKSTQKKK